MRLLRVFHISGELRRHYSGQLSIHRIRDSLGSLRVFEKTVNSEAILRHSTVEVTRLAYIQNEASDPRGLAAMDQLSSALCNQYATGTGNGAGKSAVNYGN